MTVYVDKAEWEWRGKMWCHLLADDLTELHDFAKKLGMQKAWFQKPPKVKFPHYDITESKRDIAIKLGAVPLESKAATMGIAYKLRNEFLGVSDESR